MLMGHRPRASRKASVAVGIARLPIVAVGHAIAVPVATGMASAPAVGCRVVAVGDAVMVAIPAARLHVPLAAAFHPLGRTVAVAGACLDPIAVHPHMLVAAPFPV